MRKIGVFAVDFRGRARNWWVYWLVIGHRFRVGAKGGTDKAQEWCRLVWTGVEMWEMRPEFVRKCRAYGEASEYSLLIAPTVI